MNAGKKSYYTAFPVCHLRVTFSQSLEINRGGEDKTIGSGRRAKEENEG